MVPSREQPLPLGTAFRRTASLPPKEVRSPRMPEVQLPNSLLQTDIASMSRMPVVRSFPPLYAHLSPTSCRSMGHPHTYHTEIERPRRHHPCVCIPSPDSPVELFFFLAITVLSPRMGSSGWPFGDVDPFHGADADPLYNAQHVKDLYLRADPDYGGRCAIPST